MSADLITPLILHVFDDATTWRFTPQVDITAYEHALITNLLLRLVIAKSSIPDWRPYVEEHKLERHFTLETEAV